jgi:formate dehydrogenase major subunit
MTNHWIDIKNSDCILVMGANPAENHPISFRYVMQAKDNGAKLICVDPRFTRTAAVADIYAPLRSGTDIAFLGGMIKYILDNRLYQEIYVANYTNAQFIVNKQYGFKDGLFAGFDPENKSYDKTKWAFETDTKGVPRRDVRLRHKRCVFQLLKTHYARYDLKIVSKITGTSEESLMEVYKTFTATGASSLAGTVMYAMGWTQHTTGVQNIRAMSIIQLLLGNMGLAGGGINALRGENNVQGSTDHALLFHILPGYLKIPRDSDKNLAAYNARYTPSSNDPRSVNWWRNYPKYSVSFLKSMFGENATPANDFGYEWMPKCKDGRSYSWWKLFQAMWHGRVKGFFAWGMNPAASCGNATIIRECLTRLDWMVHVNLFDTETSAFWRGPGMKPEETKTEVFSLPACAWVEKEGSVTNSGRWMQWRYPGPKPLGQSKSDGHILMELGSKLKALYARGGTFSDPIRNLKWDYTTHGEFDSHKVAKEINGYFLEDVTIDGKIYKKGSLVPSFVHLRDDGRTSSGNWLYCNSYTEEGNNSARQGQQDAPNNLGNFPDFAWSWPLNRRIIYNRAAVDLKGQPWNSRHWVVRFDGEVKNGKFVSGKWIGDIVDGGGMPLQHPDGSENDDGRYPFIMRPHGLGQIFGPGLKDGPFPEHYEPLESPIANNFLSSRRRNPLLRYSKKGDRPAEADPRFPLVCTSYRVTEHWQTVTRVIPWNLELQPQVFVEMSHELAEIKGIKKGERVLVESSRGKLECTAVVTHRLKPMLIGNQTVHQVGIPWNYGWRWPEKGTERSVNILISTAVDPGAEIPEYKAFMVNIRKIDSVS